MRGLGQILWKWTWRALAVVLAFSAAVYVGDFALYRLRGSPRAKVKVEQFLAVPLKANKVEIDYQGSLDEPCSESLFGQDGMEACWQLRRHRIQQTNL